MPISTPSPSIGGIGTCALPPTAAKKGLVNKAKRFVEGARLDPAWGHARWRVFCDERVRNALNAPAQVRTFVAQYLKDAYK